ncbi:unnamed protein product, partial [Brenthis ino]
MIATPNDRSDEVFQLFNIEILRPYSCTEPMDADDNDLHEKGYHSRAFELWRRAGVACWLSRLVVATEGRTAGGHFMCARAPYTHALVDPREN